MLGATDFDLLQFIKDGGVVVETLVIVWAILTKRLVPGWAYRESVEREAKWEKLALEGTTIARDSVDTLRRVTPAPTEGDR